MPNPQHKRKKISRNIKNLVVRGWKFARARPILSE